MKKDDEFYIFVEGINLHAIHKLDFIDHKTIESNDIRAIYSFYGVEAARMSIIKEVTSVFGHYGVSVDPRHLQLISDYLTNNGMIKAMNRIWMRDSVSPFLKMSFETSTKFLT